MSENSAPKAALLVLALLAVVMTGCHDPRRAALMELQGELANRQMARQRSAELHTKAREALEAGDIRQARADLFMALEADERNAAAWMTLGRLEYEAENLTEAAQAFHRAARLAPTRYEPRFNLGSVLERAGRYDRAITEYESALKLAPDQVEVMENLARCYIKTRTKLPTARHLIGQALLVESRPDWVRWLKLESDRLGRGGDTAQADIVRDVESN